MSNRTHIKCPTCRNLWDEDGTGPCANYGPDNSHYTPIIFNASPCPAVDNNYISHYWGYLMRGSIFSYVGYSGTNIAHEDIYVKNVHEQDGMIRGTDTDGYELEFTKDQFKCNLLSSVIRYAYDGD